LELLALPLVLPLELASELALELASELCFFKARTKHCVRKSTKYDYKSINVETSAYLLMELVTLSELS
jgi:hypothetical protein